MSDDLDARRRSMIVLGTGILAATAASAQNAPPAKALRIVLHVSEADAWPAALSNARNLSGKFPAVRVRVIADGSAVYGYQGSNDVVAAMAATAKAGVEYQACNNALDEKKIPVSSMPPFVKVVPAGVVSLAESQAEGYAYVKP